MECPSIFFRSHFIAGLVALLGLGAWNADAQPANTIMLERWDNISGTSVTDLTNNANYPNNPTSRTYPTLYEIPINAADNYGTRTRGYVTAPTTGNYIFWVSGDDNSELWLGTNDQPSTIRRIAYVPGWTNSREWTKFGEQQSASIPLTAGVRYYIETRQKEGGGGDNLAVGWQLPSGTQERPIPGNRLSPFLLTTPPAITTQPSSVTVVQGQTATFTVVATGTAPLSYQWRRNGSNIAGATSSSYTTPPTTLADNAIPYSVVVSNSAGNITSANAVLTVNAAPTITSQPVSVTVNQGQTATFSVVATGTAPLSYQWRRNGSNIAGATSPTYTTPPATLADNAIPYSVVVSNSVGNITSANAVLTVNAAPVITSQPQSDTVIQGQTASFSVTATGSMPLNYQWYRNGSPISGATNSTYNFIASPSDHGSTFFVSVTNSLGSVNSNNAQLVVWIPPTISSQPASLTVTSGQTASFSVFATGTSPLSYQWRRNGSNIPGATAASYTTAPVTSADHGAQFSVVVSNVAGNVTSANALLSVIYVATNSRKIAVSGEMYDAAGNPVGQPTPVFVDVIARLFNDSATGTSLYTEEFRAAAGKAVKVDQGLFVARLGEGTTTGNLQQTLANHANLWVEITIDDGTPDILTPRTPLTASAYALGGTSAPAVAASLAGSGEPNNLGIEGPVGATYVNGLDQSTWIKLQSGWKRLD